MWNPNLAFRWSHIISFCFPMMLVGLLAQARPERTFPNAAPRDTFHADSATNDTRFSRAIDSVRTRIAAVEKKIEKPPKDIWDKVAAAGSLLSGIIVAIIGFYATTIYNRRQKAAEESHRDRQLLVSQVQTVERFITHLSSQNESAKSAALIMIAALGNEELAVKLARLFGGTGSTTALTTIANSSGAGAKSAERALSDLFEYLKPRVVTIHGEHGRRASGFMATDDGLIVTAAHVLKGLPLGSIRVGMPSGQLVSATAVSSDERLDLAAVRVSTSSDLPFIASSVIVPDIGTRVIALLIMLNGALEVRVGSVIGLGAQTNPLTPETIIVQVEVMLGSSGTPVLDEEGRLIGIVQATDGVDSRSQNKTYLISATTIAGFLEQVRDADPNLHAHE